jgi:hypothetical protein
MANQLAEKKETPAARTYSEAEMRAATAEASARALYDSNIALQQAAIARNVMPPQAPPPRGPDGFDVFAKEGLTRSPEEQARMLRGGTAGVVRGELAQAVAAIRQESDWKLQQAVGQTRDEMAMRSVLNSNPDIAADEEGFAAALAKAAYRASQRGMNLDGPTMAQHAVNVYKEDHKPAAEDAPTFEGGSRPAGSGGLGKKKDDGPNPVLDFLTKSYGVGGPTDEVHGETRDFAEEDAIDGYLEGRLTPDTSGPIPIWGITQPLADGLAGTGMGSGVRQAQGDFNKRKAQRAAAGGK